MACESKSNLTICPTSLMNKLLFRDISCSFLIIVLIVTVSLSLSSNKLGNNFNNCDNNLLMPMPLLLIFKKALSCNWLDTTNNFWCRQELKISISGAFFEEKIFSFYNLTHAVFWAIGELFYKNPLKRLVLKSQFQNPQILDEKFFFNFFTIHAKTTSSSLPNRN